MLLVAGMLVTTGIGCGDSTKEKKEKDKSGKPADKDGKPAADKKMTDK
jgi:hypothetical protein